MVQAPERPAVSAREELRAVLAAFRQASANLRQEVRLARERRLSAVQAADQQRASARAAAEQAFRRITAIYERARSTLLGASQLSQADRTTRLELLLGGFSGLGEVSLEPNASDPAREIALQAERAETALRYIRQALGLDGDDLRQGARLAARLLAGLVVALGCSLIVSSLVLGAMAGVTLAGMVVLVIGLAGTLVLPPLTREAASDLRTPAAAFDQLARALAQARRAYRRWNEEIEATHERRVREAESAYQQSIELLQPLFTQVTSNITPALSALQERLGPWLLEWSDERWASWAPPSELPPVVRLGSLLAGTAPYQLEVPAFLPLPPGRPLLLKSAPATHPQASGALTALLARLLATFPPAQLSFSLFDPLGHGQSLAPFLQLADYDDQLVRGRVWVGLDEIEDELGALLDEVSHAPASSTAPGQRLHLVVVLNFPEGFSELAAMRLWRLFQQGPSAGVWPLVLVDLERPLPVGLKLADLEREATVIGSRAGRFLFEEEGLSDCELRLDPPPPAPLLTRLVQGIGRALSRYRVLFDQIVPPEERWWQGEAGRQLSIPVGTHPGGEPFVLPLGGSTPFHLAVAGRPASGKSSFLRTLALSLALGYRPGEVTIFLYDCSGSELLTPFTNRIPHLHYERLASAQELPLKLLQPLRTELDRRAPLRRTPELPSLEAYRQRTGVSLPRLVALFDGLDDLYLRAGTTASEVTKTFSALLSPPGDSGVSVVMTFRSLGRVPQPIRGLIPRVASGLFLPPEETEARTFLSGAPAPSAPGEALFTPSFGRPELQPLLVAHLGQARLEYYLSMLASLARGR
jgi:tetratricopeptide (TPR) repeat protein